MNYIPCVHAHFMNKNPFPHWLVEKRITETLSLLLSYTFESDFFSRTSRKYINAVRWISGTRGTGPCARWNVWRRRGWEKYRSGRASAWNIISCVCRMERSETERRNGGNGPCNGEVNNGEYLERGYRWVLCCKWLRNYWFWNWRWIHSCCGIGYWEVRPSFAFRFL